MYGIEVVVDNNGNIIINIDQKELQHHLMEEITRLGKEKNATSEEIQVGLNSLLKAQVQFGVIR